MKRIVSLTLAVAILLLLVSCGKEKNRSYDEAEVKEAADLLIWKSAELNEIFWGEGIPYEEYGYNSGIYYSADPIFLKKLGAYTVEEIIEKTQEVFSKDYTANIYASIFSSQVGENSMLGYTRYYQGEECIMVNSRYNSLITDSIDYITSEIEVVGSKGDIVIVKVPIKVTRDGNTQERTIEVNLVEEEGGWRIDSPTYAVYDEGIPEN